jgi:hypothetical protein
VNLIEAWKKAKERQTLKRPDCNLCITKVESHLFPSVCETISSVSLLADDWEIEKEKKKVVIEGVHWDCSEIPKYCKEGMYVLAYGGIVNKYKDEIPLLTPMKMTLEWEE